MSDMPGPEGPRKGPDRDPKETGHGPSAPDQAAGAAPHTPSPGVPEVTSGPGTTAGGKPESATAAGWTSNLRPSAEPTAPGGIGGLPVAEGTTASRPPIRRPDSPAGRPAGSETSGPRRDDSRDPLTPPVPGGRTTIYRPGEGYPGAGPTPGNPPRPEATPRVGDAPDRDDGGTGPKSPFTRDPGGVRGGSFPGQRRFEDDTQTDMRPPKEPGGVKKWLKRAGLTLAGLAVVGGIAKGADIVLNDEPKNNAPTATETSGDTGVFDTTPPPTQPTTSPSNTEGVIPSVVTSSSTTSSSSAEATPDATATGAPSGSASESDAAEPTTSTTTSSSAAEAIPGATATGAPSESTAPSGSASSSASSSESAASSPSSSADADTDPVPDPSTDPAPNPGTGSGQQPGGQQPGAGAGATTMTVEQLIAGAKQEGAVAETTLKALHAGTEWDADKKALNKMDMDTDAANINPISHTNQGLGALEGKDINNIKAGTTLDLVTTGDQKFLATIGGEITPEQMKKLQERYPKSEFVKALADLKDLNYRDADTPKKEIKADDIAAAVNYLKIVNVTTSEQRAALAKAIEKGDLTTINKIVSASEDNFRDIVVSPAPAAAAPVAPAAGPQNETPPQEVKPATAPLLTVEGDMPASVVETVTVDEDIQDIWNEAQELLKKHTDLTDQFVESKAATPLVNGVMAFIEGTNNTDTIPKDRQLKVPTKNVVRLFATTHTYANRPADQTPLYMQSFVRDYKAFGVSIPQGTHQENPKDKTRPFIKDFAARSNIHIKAYQTIMSERPGQAIEDVMTQLNLVTEITNYINSLPEDEREQYKAFFDGDVNLTNLVLGTDKNQTDPKLAAIQTEYAKYASLDPKKATPEDVTTIIKDLLTAVANARN